MFVNLASRNKPRQLPQSIPPTLFSHSKLVVDTASSFGGLFNESEYLNYVASNDTMIDELERFWKEAVWPREVEEMHQKPVRTAGVPPESRIRVVPLDKPFSTMCVGIN